MAKVKHAVKNVNFVSTGIDPEEKINVTLLCQETNSAGEITP